MPDMSQYQSFSPKGNIQSDPPSEYQPPPHYVEGHMTPEYVEWRNSVRRRFSRIVMVSGVAMLALCLYITLVWFPRHSSNGRSEPTGLMVRPTPGSLSNVLVKRVDPGSVVLAGIGLVFGAVTFTAANCNGDSGNGAASCFFGTVFSILGIILAGTARTATSIAIFGRKRDGYTPSDWSFPEWNIGGVAMSDPYVWNDFIRTESDWLVHSAAEHPNHVLWTKSWGNGTLSHLAFLNKPDYQFQPVSTDNGGLEIRCVDCVSPPERTEDYVGAGYQNFGGDAESDLDMGDGDISAMASVVSNSFQAADASGASITIGDPVGQVITGSIYIDATQVQENIVLLPTTTAAPAAAPSTTPTPTPAPTKRF